MIKIGLTEQEIKNLESKGYIFEVRKGEFLSLDKNENENIIFIEMKGGLK